MFKPEGSIAFDFVFKQIFYQKFILLCN